VIGRWCPEIIAIIQIILNLSHLTLCWLGSFDRPVVYDMRKMKLKNDNSPSWELVRIHYKQQTNKFDISYHQIAPIGPHVRKDINEDSCNSFKAFTFERFCCENWVLDPSARTQSAEDLNYVLLGTTQIVEHYWYFRNRDVYLRQLDFLNFV